MRSVYSLSALSFIFCALHAVAAPIRIDLSQELTKINAKNLYDLDPKTKDSQLAALSRMKYFEIKKNWKGCADLGPKVITGNSEIQGWIAASWLRCNLKLSDTTKIKKPLSGPVNWLLKHRSVMTEGPWKASLWQDFVGASMTILDLDRSPARVSEMLEFSETLPKESRAILLGYSGEFAEKKKDFKQALYFYEQSLLIKDNKALREKFEGVKLVLKLKFETSPASIDGVLENEGAEAALEEKMNKALRASDLITGLKTAVLIETEYAGSRVARRLKDRPFEIYQDLIENVPKDEKDQVAFVELEKVGSIRLAEWAQTLHRRANYQQALIFSERALKDLYQTPQATLLYWVAGRSAHFVGQYDRAQMHFAKLIEFHSGSDEAVEALLRSGLIHLRLKNYASAETQFQKLLAQKKDRYDLIARYWLVRTLENTDKDRALVESKTLIDRYPLSYYGLRLVAENNKGEYQWPPNAADVPDGTSDMWLVGDQAKAWARFKALTKAGWLLEAQSEAQQLPMTKNPYLEYHYAKFMAATFQFPIAIRAMNDAMDLENSLRSPDTLATVYPKSFSPWIEAESKKYSVSPILIRSLIRQESAFGIRALSTSNAQGLMQLIPGTAQDVARRIGLKKLDFPEDVFRPEINIPLGTFYISLMIDQFAGNVPFALGAYNAGPTKMKIFTEARDDVKSVMLKPSSSPADEIWIDELPWTETSFYIKAILRNSLLYKLIDAAKIDWTLVLWQDLQSKKPNMK
jgi:soluble lytic murein transglycosylase